MSRARNRAGIAEADGAIPSAVNNASSHPNDVCIVFPRPSGAVLELWANSTVLGEASPYLKTLLESDFAEGCKRSATAHLASSPHESGINAESCMTLADDSDDEADKAVAQDRKEKTPSSIGGDHEYHKLTPNASYTTYRALLSWLHSGHLPFASFRTSTSAQSTSVDASSPRTLAYHESLLNTPSLPLATSPKSMYRLAHLIDIPELQTLALAEIKRQLTVENVATSVLFTELALSYGDVKKVALDYAAGYWWRVKVTEGYKEAKARAKEDVERYEQVLFELLEGVG